MSIEIHDGTRELTRLLSQAADGRDGAIELFFRALLNGSVFVPVKPETAKAADNSLELIGAGEGKHDFQTVDYDGKECIPIFTEESFLNEWAGQEVPLISKQFKTLLWMVGDDTWLYLNPNQPVGKEITAWEVELLRQGEDAIPDLVAALNEEPLGEIEVNSGSDKFNDLKQKLLPIVEIYPELEEAFLVSVKEGGSEVEKPMVGIRWRNANEGKKAYVKTEIEALVSESKPEGVDTVFVIDDLEDRDSPNHSLFSDATPFYFSRPFQDPKGPNWKQKLGRVFAKKKD